MSAIDAASSTHVAARDTGADGASAPALVHAPLGATIRRVALPAVASNLLMTLFGSFDTWWVSRHLGVDAVAAVTASIFWIWGIVSVAEIVGVGLTAVAARRHGEGHAASAATAASDGLLLALTYGVLMATAGEVLLPALFRSMAVSAEVQRFGEAYLGTYLWGAPVLFGYFAIDATFRASGDTRTPLVLLSTSVLINLVLDPALILGWWGLPTMGVRGAAIATVGVRGVACVVGLALLLRRGLLRWRAPDWATWATITRVGLPIALTGVLFSGIYTRLARVIAPLGAPALAALGIGHRLEGWMYMVGVGFGAAAAAVVGQNLGAGQIDRAMRTGWIATAYATMPAAGVALIQLLAPGWFASIFTTDPAVLDEAIRYLRTASLSTLFIAAELVLEECLGGAGSSVPPMVASSTITLLRLPLAAWAIARWGSTGLWWVLAMTAAARGVAMMALWRSGRWMRAHV
ncbi:MAG: MATE family efflux transporter [Gemmatimonadaceae bacterium]|nr:MATE family efflux transporter [Gemmatimonadaceae bacterium]